jgi:hypothetical protein
MRGTAFGFLLLLTGCAGPIETRISSDGSTSISPAQFSVEKTSNIAGATAQDLVIKALSQKGFQLADPAMHSLHVSVSDRPSHLAINAGEKTLSPATDKKLCAAREFRLGITLTRIADGAVTYQAHAAEYHCKQTLSQVLPYLVDAVVNDLGSPRGSYIVKRPRR